MYSLNKALVKKGVDVTVDTTNVGLSGEAAVNQNIDGPNVFYSEFAKLFEFMGETSWQFSWRMTKDLSKNLESFGISYLSGI